MIEKRKISENLEASFGYGDGHIEVGLKLPWPLGTYTTKIDMEELDIAFRAISEAQKYSNGELDNPQGIVQTQAISENVTLSFGHEDGHVDISVRLPVVGSHIMRIDRSVAAMVASVFGDAMTYAENVRAAKGKKIFDSKS